MDTTVSMHAVVFGLTAALALLCAVVYAGMRKQSALIWLAAALACAGVETVMLADSVRTDLAVAAVTCLVPAAYLCLSQTIRALFRLPSTSWKLFAAVVALSLISLGMLAAGAPDLLQTVPFQIGGALALGDSFLCLFRRKEKDFLDKGLLAVLFLMAIIYVARIPLFPLLFDETARNAAFERSTLQRLLLTAAMITTPTSVVLIIAKIVRSIITGHRQRSELDYLTGLPNRRSFERAASRASAVGGAVVVCDIDHFKQINDRYGHAVGDDIIRVFASLLHTEAGSPARIGGEEFALLLPGATVEEAAVLADAIREKFHALRYPALGRDHRLSASFGIAGFDHGEPAQTALVHADRALYQAKNDGRNRVVVFGEDLTEESVLSVA